MDFLRQRLASGRVLERTVVASADWRTNVFIRRDYKDIAEEGAKEPPQIRRTGSVGMLMSARGAPTMSPEQQREEQLTVEAALVALSQRRHIVLGVAIADGDGVGACHATHRLRRRSAGASPVVRRARPAGIHDGPVTPRSTAE